MTIQFNAYGKHAYFTDGLLFVEKQFIGEFAGLKEAKEHVYAMHLSEEVLSETTHKRTLTSDDVAVALNESNEIEKVTENIVDYFTEMVDTKFYYPSNALVSLRESAGLDHFNRIDYVLNDGSVVLMDVDTNKKLNNIIKLDESANTLKYMLRNSESFVAVAGRLLKD